MKGIILFTLSIIVSMLVIAQEKYKKFHVWESFTNIPDSVGFAGAFAGVINDRLVVAGGSNFPNGGAPWRGSAKVWYDDIYVLDSPMGEWKHMAKLPKKLGYGVSISLPWGMLLIGGSNEDGHYADVYQLQYSNGKIIIDTLPSLPIPLANSCGALVGSKVYVAGGQQQPSDLETLRTLFCLDLNDMTHGWRRLADIPGPSRMLAVAASDEECFYVFSGAQLINGKRKYLTDAYRLKADKWERIEDLPVATVAAPTPAYATSEGIYVFGGDDGTLANSDLRERHPGFSKNIIRYDKANNEWRKAGEIKVQIHQDAILQPNNSIWAPVTTTAVLWEERYVLPGGEVRPATRTPRVIAVKLD
jgi:Uncharacterized protein conserved in bacteria